MAKFGGSEFKNCSIPLAFAGHYFIIEPGTPNPLISIVIEHEDKPVFVVYRNEPKDSNLYNVTKTPPGIITVAEKSTGRFLYKVRPGSETSLVFGTIKGDKISAIINDRLIKVGGIQIENCVFSGVGAGIVVDEHGGVGIGCPIPPALIQLFM